jgi:hypothetical protein
MLSRNVGHQSSIDVGHIQDEWRPQGKSRSADQNDEEKHEDDEK